MGYSAEIKEVHSKVSELDGRNQGCTKATLASDIGLTEIKMVYLNDMRTKLRQMKENKSPRMVSCARISLIQAWTQHSKYFPPQYCCKDTETLFGLFNLRRHYCCPLLRLKLKMLEVTVPLICRAFHTTDGGVQVSSCSH